MIKIILLLAFVFSANLAKADSAQISFNGFESFRLFGYSSDSAKLHTDAKRSKRWELSYLSGEKAGLLLGIGKGTDYASYYKDNAAKTATDNYSSVEDFSFLRLGYWFRSDDEWKALLSGSVGTGTFQFTGPYSNLSKEGVVIWSVEAKLQKAFKIFDFTKPFINFGIGYTRTEVGDFETGGEQFTSSKFNDLLPSIVLIFGLGFEF